MDYIIHTRITYNHLSQQGLQWRIIQFFFDYRAHDGLANNEIGMLRAFLYQLADKDERINDRLYKLYSREDLILTDKDRLLDAVQEAIGATDNNICIFIDGLDEYENSKVELVDMIKNINKTAAGRAKICLAGRPEPTLGGLLCLCPKIEMHHYNQQTMFAIIEKKNQDAD